jgi:hypothetical protein
MPTPYHISAQTPARTLFCFGFGYSAQHLAALLAPQGWTVLGTHRSAHKTSDILFDGLSPIPHFQERFAGITALLLSIPPDRNGCPVLRHHRQDLAKLSSLQWIGYLSTTGVYGDWGGAWVDENSPLRPASPRTKARVDAEQAWLATGLPVHVFRLAGIYGHGRNVLEEVRAGEARRLYKEGQVFSRIHVEDIAQTLATSLAKPSPGQIYNVCDHLPAAPGDPVAYACELLGVPTPPLIPWSEANLSPMGVSFYQECKRVSNRKLREELGVTLRYPTYREGLKALYSFFP